MTLERMKQSIEMGLMSSSYFGEDKFHWRWRDEIDSYQDLTTEEIPEKAISLILHLYTEDHRYAISMGESSGRNGNGTYLGCTVSDRKPRPSEDWTRGNDLHDGEFNSKTIALILLDILGYECKRISKQTPITIIA